MHTGKSWVPIVGIIAIILIIVAIIVFVVNAESLQKFFFNDAGTDSKTASWYYNEMRQVKIGDQTYIQRDGISTFLIIGLDSFGSAVSSGSYNNSQQADFLTLVIVDNNEEKYSILHINRDTMTDINVLDITGTKVVRKMNAQIALSHTYGDGLQVSCLNTADAVSKLLYGIKIDYYLSMTMDAAEIITDKLEGVTIRINQDLTMVNEDWYEGAVVTLSGADALEYVRLRSELPDSSNLARMDRQKIFMNALIDKLISTRRSTEGSNSFFLSMYDAVADYIVTNGSASKFTEMADKLSQYQDGGIMSPEGEAAKGTKFMEFYVDEEKLQQLAIRLFYRKV